MATSPLLECLLHLAKTHRYIAKREVTKKFIASKLHSIPNPSSWVEVFQGWWDDARVLSLCSVGEENGKCMHGSRVKCDFFDGQEPSQTVVDTMLGLYDIIDNCVTCECLLRLAIDHICDTVHHGIMEKGHTYFSRSAAHDPVQTKRRSLDEDHVRMVVQDAGNKKMSTSRLLVGQGQTSEGMVASGRRRQHAKYSQQRGCHFTPHLAYMCVWMRRGWETLAKTPRLSLLWTQPQGRRHCSRHRRLHMMNLHGCMVCTIPLGKELGYKSIDSNGAFLRSHMRFCF